MKSPGTGPQTELTEMLRAWSNGDAGALERLTPVLEEELKRIARRKMARERPEHTLQPTALVNEAYLQLVNAQGVEWQDRAHFFALASRMMRRILVNYAKARASSKRAGAAVRITFDEEVLVAQGRGAQVVALDEALERLGELDPRKARVVELRFFGGLSAEETAAILDVSPQTVLRDWSLAKSWLARELMNS